jgi:hypothetical protein
MSIKTKGIGALFVVLVIILAVKPRLVHNMYSTILGRVFLLGVVIFMSMNNLTLGLLAALTIIAASNQFGSLVEGLDNIGDDNTEVTGEQQVLTKSAVATAMKDKLSEIKNKTDELGIDKEDIKNAIASKDSKSIPLDPSAMKSEDVSAYKESMLNNSSRLTEGFCPCAASLM